jgi:hypothetical protein
MIRNNAPQKMEGVVEGTIKNEESSADPPPSHEWAKLIRKLRWIGLDDEARRLELAVRARPGAIAPVRGLSG